MPASQVMQTAFVNNSLSTEGEVEMITTPVNMSISMNDGLLNPAYTRPSQQTADDLDTQPMRGPKEPGNTTSELLEHFIDNNYGDMLGTSVLNPNSYMTPTISQDITTTTTRT